MTEFFRRVAHRATLAVGSWQFFVLAIVMLLVWAATGPLFAFSDALQLIVNTTTTILTFIFGILILLEANRQGRESKVVHDELLEHTRGARTSLVNIDEMTDHEVGAIEKQLRDRARKRVVG